MWAGILATSNCLMAQRIPVRRTGATLTISGDQIQSFALLAGVLHALMRLD